MSSSPINPAFYADPSALASLKHDAKAQDPAALKEAAKQFESLFTKMLLKSMREANEGSGDSLFGSDQTEFYQGMFDDQLAVQLSQGRGLGLAEMLVRQLTQVGDRGQGTGDREKKVNATEASTLSPIPRPLSPSKEDFVRQMLPHAEQAARELGVDANALIAQAALETGWGRAVPGNATGNCSFNLFGIKAGGHWNGATVNVPTIEFEEGLPVRRVERFRAYDSPADSFRDYAALIRNNPRYESALGAGTDVASFAAALQQGGYATDPGYADKVLAVAKQVRAMTNQNSFKSADLGPLNLYGGAG
jgi:flagellar protein FlgJ